MTLHVYNSLTRRQEPFVPLQPGQVGLYTCGPTVYNYAHIGNFRCYMFEDLLKRTLLFLGFKVNHVMNLTDVDDKTIRGSQKAGLPLNDFTRTFKEAFFADLQTLRIIPAALFPAATEHIAEMIEIIQKLMDLGIAYQADDHSVYFSIDKCPQYGQLVNLDRSQMRSGVRVKLDEYAKESLADFALWKAWDPDDGDVFWESPWGRGRPGWHLECSAMSAKYLGKTFDMHCGGIDNMFPHHEDEIAQSEAAHGCKFVNYWLHCAHLVVDGQKMSKSLGNFFTLRDIVERGYTGREVRLVLLGAHYRQSLNFSFKALDDARATLQRLDAFNRRLDELAGQPEAALDELTPLLDRAGEAFRAALADDLNISAALAALFDLVRDVNRLADNGAMGGNGVRAVQALLRQMDSVLDICRPEAVAEVPAEITALAEERQQARKARDFARADALRARLDELGWLIEDTPKGPRLVRRG